MSHKNCSGLLKNIDIGEVGLRISALLLPGTDVKQGNAEIDGIVRFVAEIVGDRTDPEYRIRALNTVLYRKLGFDYDKEDPLGRRPENGLLWRYLQTKHGNCVTMPLLWYAVAQRLGYPVKAVNAPQHFFLRFDVEGGKPVNIETTSGAVPTDEMIIRDLEIPPEAIRSGTFMRSLSKREFVAELIACLGAQEAGRMNFALARELLLVAERVVPESLTVHWNLALVYSAVAQVHSARRLAKTRVDSDSEQHLPTAPEQMPEYAEALKHAQRVGVTPQRMMELHDLNGFSYAGGNPTRWVDPTGLEPNRSQAITAEETIDTVKRFFRSRPADITSLRYSEGAAGGGRQVGPFGGDSGGRYVWTSKRGWIDLGHFFQVAGQSKLELDQRRWAPKAAVKFGPGRAYLNRKLWEKTQEVEDRQKATGQEETAWSYEDPSSNQAGLDFFLDYYTDDAHLEEALQRFFSNAGAEDPTDAPNWGVIQDHSVATSGHGWFEKAPRSMEPVLDPKRVWWPKKHPPNKAASGAQRAPAQP